MQGKQVLVVGMARSGVAVAKLLAEKQAKVRISDTKSRAELPDFSTELNSDVIEWRLGEPAQELLEGIDLVVISPGVPIDAPVVKAAQLQNIPVIGEVEAAYRLGQGNVVAITGTNGKTTTTSLVGKIFENAGQVTYVVGNIGNPYSSIALNSKASDWAVVEISSFQLESVDSFRPHIAAVLNITEDHLVRHKTMETYINLKKRIFENQQQSDWLVLNSDDAIVRDFAASAKAKVVFFSRTQAVEFGAYVKEGNIVFCADGASRKICAVDEVRIPGPHNLENALAATAIAMAADIPAPVIRHTLRIFGGVEHRLEFVRSLGQVRFINDSKGTNVDSTIKAVDSMGEPTVIIMGGSDKQTDFAALCKRIATSNIKHAVLIGETARQIDEALKGAGFDQITHCGYDFDLAVHTAYRLAQPGWNVLLSPACASFDMFDDYEQRGKVFKEIVHRLSELTGRTS